MRKRSLFALLLIVCMIPLALTGCKASRKKVISSSYYKNLKSKYDKLKEENKELQKQVDQTNNLSEDEERASDYLEKIARDSLTKLEIGYADNMEASELLDEKVAFSFVIELANRADRTTKYTPEEIEDQYGKRYEYILYDEDNAVYEIMVYNGDYVVFTDLPDYVYYVENASALGEAFLHYKNGYPDSRLLHRLADTPLASDSNGHYYENPVLSKAAVYINNMTKEKSSRKKAVAYWKKNQKTGMINKGIVYTCYHHGNQLKLTLYDEFIRIENMDGKATWYKTDADNVNAIRAYFTDEQKTQEKEDQTDETTETTQKSHYEEMESESGTTESESDTDAVSD